MCKLRKFIVTHFWQKFRESSGYTKKLLNSWFDEIFFGEIFFFIFPQCILMLRFMCIQFWRIEIFKSAMSDWAIRLVMGRNQDFRESSLNVISHFTKCMKYMIDVLTYFFAQIFAWFHVKLLNVKRVMLKIALKCEFSVNVNWMTHYYFRFRLVMGCNQDFRESSRNVISLQTICVKRVIRVWITFFHIFHNFEWKISILWNAKSCFR